MQMIWKLEFCLAPIGRVGILVPIYEKTFRYIQKKHIQPIVLQKRGGRAFSEVFHHYLKCSAVLSIVMTVALGIIFVPAGIIFIKKYAPDFVKNQYPEELVVSIKKGEVSANVPMPYFVSVRSMTGATSTGAMQNLLVIDTEHDFEKKTFESFKTYTFLTKTDLITSSDNGQITIQTLRGIPDATISRSVLLSWVEKVRQSLYPIAVLGVVTAFLIFMCGYLIYLVPLFLFALIPFGVAWIKRMPLSYIGAYKMSLYAIVPALALKTVVNIFGVFFLPSYFVLLVFMLIIAINMRDAENSK